MKWPAPFKRASAPPPAPARTPSQVELSAGGDDALIGKRLNETYVVEGVIGEGGMGRVYRARHTRIASKEFAIKVLHQEYTRNPEVVARFRREAEAAACIAHPNVVGVYDVDTTVDGYSYLVCEYLVGRDLAEWIAENGRLTLPAAVHVGVESCRALEAAHARGVVHRDLKPHNVFLLAGEASRSADHPAVKILDFGLSRFVDSNETQLTRTGVIMGTPAYMAPEQAEGTGTDERTDVYGLGAVLFTALTGKLPFDAETVQGVVLAVLTQEAPRPRAHCPDIPENLELVVQRAMARKREERYQSMAELRQALEPFLGLEAGPVATSGPRNFEAQRSSRALLEADARTVSTARPRLVLYAVLSLVLLIAGLGSTVSSVELVTGKLRFTRGEVLFALLALVGTLLTPGLILLFRIKKRVWGNHTRVLLLLESVRAGLFAALMAYGLAAVAVRFLDDVVGRFGISPLLGGASGEGWAGWNLMLLLVALVTGVSSALRRRLARSPGIARRFAPALPAVAVVLSVSFLYAGLLWRSGRTTGDVMRQALPVVPALSGTPANALSAPLPQQGRDAAPARDAERTTKAPADELAAASAAGVEGLLPLSERYPEDPAVLKPLMLAFAGRATGLVDAMAVGKRLFLMAPEETYDEALRLLVKKAAAAPGEASKLAFDLMNEHMGGAGPDLLYELMLSKTKPAERARELLVGEAARARATPALSVAYQLRMAKDCAARLPFLKRAAELGDERSIAVLQPLSIGSRRGCGRWRRQSCPPVCAAEAARYVETVTRIAKRLAATRRAP